MGLEIKNLVRSERLCIRTARPNLQNIVRNYQYLGGSLYDSSGFRS